MVWISECKEWHKPRFSMEVDESTVKKVKPKPIESYQK